MDNEKIIFWRNFLIRSFLIGLLVLIFLFTVTTCGWNVISSFIGGTFGVESTALGVLMVKAFLNIRLVILFVFLVPAVALHTMIKKK